MPPLPLFTKAELQAGFALILPAASATEAAEEWWALFADEVDDRGYFLFDQDPTSPAHRSNNALALAGRQQTDAQRDAQERALWGGMSVAERRELLIRFSSFHFRLLGLVSDDLFDRMRLAEGLSLSAAEPARAQMRRIVAAIQAGQR
jgi:hypothetical protein